MMRGWKILAVSLFFIFIILASTACGSGQSQTQQQVQVVKGDISLIVSGSGKVEADIDATPSFGNGGKITELKVKEGDPVRKGDILALLETDNLELALSQAKVAQAQAEVASTQTLMALTQAQTALTTAQFNLDKTQAVAELKDTITTLQNKIAAAQVNLDQARASNDIDGINIMTAYLSSMQVELLNEQNKLQTLLSKPEYADTSAYYLLIAGQTYDRLVVEDVRLKQLAVESAQLSVTQAEQNIELTKNTLDQANKALAVAQNQLNNATITAPIDGTAVTVNVSEGDIVSPASAISNPLIYIVDTNTLQVTSQIDEVDIALVKEGQSVDISLDSTPDIIYEGKVESIAMAPISSFQNSGVVVYEVIVGFVDTPPEIKLGMSVTVDIIYDQKEDVLLIPSRAIKEDIEGNILVDILVNNNIESRMIELGINDGINVEVVSGLSEGDTVVITPSSQSSGLFG